MIIWLIGHLCITVLTTLIVVYCLPKSLRTQPWANAVPVVLICFFLPVLGALFCLTGLIWALRYPAPERVAPYAVYPVPALDNVPAQAPHMQYSRGGLKAVLRHADCADKRQAAVMSTRFMGDREAIPILRMVLHDLEDDVRLLAYAMLDQKEGRINASIHHLNHLLACLTSPAASASLHQRLAENYWELSYLGITEGDLKRYVLEQAYTHIAQAMASNTDLSRQVLAGKICLAQGKIEEAEQYFRSACLNPGAAQQVLPYLAEVAFVQEDYANVQHYLQQLTTTAGGVGVRAVKEHWA